MEIKSDHFKTLIVVEKSKHIKNSKKNFLILDLLFFDSSKNEFSDKKMLEKIINLQKKDFAIVFIDFQKLDKGKLINLKTTEKKYNTLLTILKGEIGILIGTEKDEFKLPSIGIIDYIYEQNFLGIDKKSKGFYCSKLKKPSKNKIKKISISELFCQNSKINFISLKTFLQSDNLIPENTSKKFPFENIICKNDEIYKPLKNLIKKNSKEKICIILIGSPGSGKSYFSTQCLPKDFFRLNNDTIKSVPKMNKLFTKYLNDKKNIVFDNTNPVAEKRSYYINEAKKKGYKIFALFFDLPKEFVFHLNQLRKFSFFKNKVSGSAPVVAIHVFYKRLDRPLEKEGFDSIITISKFFPKFDTDKKIRYFNYIYK